MPSNIDRITELLRQAAKPEDPNFMDIGQGFMASKAAALRGQDPQLAYQTMSRARPMMEQQNLQNQAKTELDIYNLVQQEAERGNKEAQAVFSTIFELSGNDPQIASTLMAELEKDPEDINSGNVLRKAIPVAAKLGITAPKPKSTAPAGLQEKTRSEIDAIDLSIKNIDTLLNEVKSKPGDFGIPGMAKDISQTIVGGMSDIAQSVPALSGLENFTAPLKQSTGGDLVAKYTPLENNLAAALASARVGGGKPAVYVLEQAKKDVSLRGIRSSSQISAKLEGIKQELQERRKSTGSTAEYLGIEVSQPRPSLEEIFQ